MNFDKLREFEIEPKRKKAEVELIKSATNNSDEIIDAVICLLKGKPGMLVVLKDRMIFAYKILFDKQIFEFYNHSITAVEFGSNALSWGMQGDLIIKTNGEDYKLTNILRKHGERISKSIRDNLNQKAVDSITAGSSSAVDQLEKLAKLKESGMITDEEFQQQKQQILNS